MIWKQNGKALFKDGNEFVSGYPISPSGRAIDSEVRLKKNEWKCVLKNGDTTLDMHIPSGGGMTLSKCRDSMVNATSFFRKYFPTEPFNNITCFFLDF